MYNEITPERKDELIDKLAQFLVKHEMTAPATLFLDTFKSLAWLGGFYATIFIEPFLPFYEKEGHELVRVLEKKENIEILLNKIEELMEKKQNYENKEKSKIKQENKKSKITNWIEKLKKKIK